jgi:FkbM family methyltransferase
LGSRFCSLGGVASSDLILPLEMNPASRLLSEIRNIAAIGGLGLAAEYALTIGRHLPAILRSRSLHCVDDAFAYHGRWFVAHAFGVSVRVPAKSMSLVREIYGRSCYFPSSSFGIEPGDNVVDLGANCGVFTALAAKLGARVLAVEAQFGYLAELRDILERNGCGADLEWALLGPSTGAFADTESRRCFEHFDGRNPPTVEIAEVLDRHGFARVDFLKCDIEGSEFDLFLHNTEWLSRVRRIAMEVHPAFGDPLVLQNLLTQRGFTVNLRNADLTGEPMDTRGGFIYATSL